MRFLALDIGDVRIGVAVSDALEIAAYPLLTLTRLGSLKRDTTAVATVAAEQEVDTIVVGLPLSLDGEVGPQAEKVQGFARALSKLVAVPLVYWDESLSSVDAEERLLAQGVSRARRRTLIDQTAAAVILESYLDHRRRTGAPRDALGSDAQVVAHYPQR